MIRNPSLKLSTLSSKTILLPSEIPTGNKSRAQGWAFHPPHHGQPSSMDSMRIHSSTGGDTELDSTVDSLMMFLASGSPTHVRTQMKNYGTTFKRTCKSGTGLNGPVNPSPHLLTLWISPSPLQGPASRPPSTRNHKTYIYTSHPTHHTLVASKRASSLVRFSASDASAQSKRTPTPTSNNSFNAYANEDTTPPH
eukprot:CCRYP_005021-RE/>CCRYP_005021-RE protein AED:0.40 eAED:1.00 QI:0/-1/0/1/-1/0/1/0/194